ncbi:ABC transporter permease [Clostridium isatidis]|uniref:ABC transporter n=1 Tax=Clostridium isatidis TaxID=182773 RepID=A0A343JBW4_9CLOT|nr:ABC transporter permease [Clostridium isatidis]ASW43022.1 ABC transporter [Clostridium isatidis]NLZ35180.1 ABC transporter permease [Clostridiales bacterium]
MDIIINVLEQGLLFGIVAMGVYITFKILNIADMSTDGTYPLGGAICAALLVKGVNPWIAVAVATIGGALAGLISALLNVKLKISSLMSGILVMTGLYSINLMIMGKSNVPLFNTKIIFDNNYKVYIIFAIAIVLKLLLDLFLKTKLGKLLIALGDNEQVITTLGVNKDIIKIIGLMISNGLIAMAGALTAQYQGFSDVTMGTGILVMALAGVIIGTSAFRKLTLLKTTTLVIIGSIIYKLAIALALKFNLDPNYLKLMTAIIVVIALSFNSNIISIKKNKRAMKVTKSNSSNGISKEGGDINAKNSSIA